jgi:conjugal transfer pilus assembly protein TraB
MTETVPSSVAVKRRQYLLLAGVGAVIVIGTVFSVSLTGSKPATERQPKPKSTNILAPGAQVDPRDAWRGQADAQLRAIDQSREMIERLRKLEGSGAASSASGGLTALPPPPIAAPATRPSFGPDTANGAQTGSGSQRAPAIPQLPPPPPPQVNRTGSFGPIPAPGSNGMPASPPSGIVSITLADPASVPAAKPGTDPAVKASAPRDTRRYIPSGAFTRALLLGGLDAPTGGQAQRNPQPVLLRLMDNAVLPNQFRSKVKECFVVGAGYGDVSSERAYIRTESLSCITRDGTAIDVPVKGYVAGEDGKAGMRGRLVSKQGQILANALLAGVASGIGQAFTQSSTTMSDLAAGHDQHRRARQATRGRPGHRRGQGPGPARPVLHQPRREGLPGDRDRRRTHRRRGAHPGHRPAGVTGRRRTGRRDLSATRSPSQPTKEFRR